MASTMVKLGATQAAAISMDLQYGPPFTPTGSILYQVDPIRAQSTILAPQGSIYRPDPPQENPESDSSGCPSISASGSVSIAGTSLSSSLSPALTLASGTATGGMRNRVFPWSDEEKAQLVRLCIANFGDFKRGKERFWSKISCLYQNLHPEGVAPNVKGYMQRYLVQCRKEQEEALGKGGIVESATEWQQSIDHWLELVRDYENQSNEEKRKTTEEHEVRKKELFTLRENMTQSLMRKKGLS
ncbi:hypothetical protein HOY80DRAFT_1045986 [Tuber brumale]|nr:hypothetical protein HOY80DRAFT_1045986 [Tuber brumale]